MKDAANDDVLWYFMMFINSSMMAQSVCPLMMCVLMLATVACGSHNDGYRRFCENSVKEHVHGTVLVRSKSLVL
jgi:hypothetical protein